MYVKSFKVSTRHSGERRFVRVSVYPDAGSMRKAALRHSQRQGYIREDEYSAAHGVTHSIDVLHIGADGSERRSPTAAHIRVYDGALGTGVLTHEVTHAALAIYGQDCLKGQGPVHEDMPQEEILCYLVGDLTARIVNKLYAFGYYGKGDDDA